MKKILLILTVLASFALVLTGCADSAVGTYAGSSGESTLNLLKNHTLTYTEIDSYGHEEHEGTWTKKGDNMTFTIKDTNSGDKMIATVDSNNVIHIPDQGHWGSESFIKINKTK